MCTANLLLHQFSFCAPVFFLTWVPKSICMAFYLEDLFQSFPKSGGLFWTALRAEGMGLWMLDVICVQWFSVGARCWALQWQLLVTHRPTPLLSDNLWSLLIKKVTIFTSRCPLPLYSTTDVWGQELMASGITEFAVSLLTITKYRSWSDMWKIMWIFYFLR